jgi:hypothetical protein
MTNTRLITCYGKKPLYLKLYNGVHRLITRKKGYTVSEWFNNGHALGRLTR